MKKVTAKTRAVKVQTQPPHRHDKHFALHLRRLLIAWRERERLGLRKAAEHIGIHYGSLHRIEHGLNVDATVLSKVMIWMLSQDLDKGLEKDAQKGTP